MINIPGLKILTTLLAFGVRKLFSIPIGRASSRSPGQSGNNRLLRKDGCEKVFGGITTFEVQPGDRRIIDTAGGGACGSL